MLLVVGAWIEAFRGLDSGDRGSAERRGYRKKVGKKEEKTR